MSQISSYPVISDPTLSDLLIGTDVGDINNTKNFRLSDIAALIGISYVPYIGATGNLNMGLYSVQASAFIVNEGSASQFLKADGSLDATAYVPQSRTITINGLTYDLSINREWDLPTIDSLTTIGTGGSATYIGKVLNIPVYQQQGDYITQLSGEATALGPGNASVILDNTAVISKILSGLNITGGNVVATDSILQAFGKVQNQINSLVGGVQYKGTWNAATNTPTLQSSVGNQGEYYVVSVPGTTDLNGITDWNLGDWAIYDGTAWQQVDNTDAVVSVNGYTGAVELTYSDVDAAPAVRLLTINGTSYDLSADRSWVVGDVRTDGSYANPTWITSLNWSKITNTPTTLSGYGITDGVNQSRTLTINGIEYDLSANRAWLVGTVTSIATSGPLTGGIITGSGTIGITKSAASVDGYLSGADWVTFNAKQDALVPVAPIYITGSNIGINQSGASSNGFLSSTDWNTFNSKQDALINPVTGTGTAYTIPMWSGPNMLTNSSISLLSNTYTFGYNSTTGASVVFLNNGAAPYAYTITMNNFGSPRITTHSYTDGVIAEVIGSTQVRRVFANGNTIFGLGTADTGYKIFTEGGVYAEYLTLNPTPATIPTAQGSMYFDEDEQTIAAILNGSTMKIGEDSFIQIKNQSGSTIPKGTSVRFDGVVGASGRVLAVPFLANGTYPSLYFLGVTYESIADGEDGKALILGKVRGINTNAYPAGTILYASTTVAGGYQTTVPLAPNNIISVAAVVTQGTSNGTILVRPQLGSNINNDEGVKIVTPVTGNILQYQSSGLWENKTLSGAGVIGGTIASGQVAFGTGSGVIGGDNGLVWDNVNKRLGVGTSSPANSKITINNTPSTPSALWIAAGNPLLTTFAETTSGNGDVIYSMASNTTTIRSSFIGRKSAGTITTPTVLSIGHQLFSLLASGFDGTSFQNSAALDFEVDGAVSTNSLPSKISFKTGVSAATRTERLGIYSNGNIGINTTTDAGYRLDVNGTARITSTLTTDVDAVVNGVNVGRGGGSISSNTRVGTNALFSNTTGGGNTANGTNALFFNTTGNNNTANGRDALFSNTTGSFNTANGINALRSNTTASANAANGFQALSSNTTGPNNTANGYQAGRFIADGTTANTITNNSIFIGFNTKALADNQTNQTVIGYNAVGLGSNTTVLGNSSTIFGRWWGNLLIGASVNSGEALQVTGTSKFTVNTTGAIASFINTNTAGTGNGVLIDVNSQLGTNNYVLNAISNGISRLYVREDGNVGIGTTSPSYNLDVSGTGRFTGVLQDGGVVHAFATKSANYTLTDNDYYITVTADATLTLPSATGRAGKRYVIKSVGAGVDVTIAGYSLLGDNENILILFSDGSNWLTEVYISGA